FVVPVRDRSHVQGCAVQHSLNLKMSGTEEPYIHVEISDDEEPWLTGTFRHFADGLKSAGVALHQRDKRGW
ncbi:hypothetical protein, partial [Deinococcus sedimenti]|uniref:hypothetical protein n=1 Tax=Deinococcus sedimenti TaxID=1867090 RepID=UPI001E5A2B84